MSNLVVMPTDRAPSRAVEAGHSAAILFFTGVRYYRMEDAAPAPTAPKRRRSTRSRAADAPTLPELQA